MKKNVFLFLSATLVSLLTLISCQKEFSVDSTNSTGGGGTGGGGNTGNTSTPGWSLTSGSKNYGGCIDTAHYQSAMGMKTLIVDGIDTAGNQFSFNLVSQTGSFAPGTYTVVSGAVLMITVSNGTTYMSATPSALSVQVSTINDTLIVATFTASLTDPVGGGSFPVTNGKLRALIGKENPCGSSTGGGGGTGGGGTTGNAVFSLDVTGGNCTSSVTGKYWKDSTLTSAHKVTLDVDVTTPGNWNLSTATVNGFKFSGSGAFTSTGIHSITLQGSGKPLAYGTTNFPVTAGTSSCGFDVLVDTVAVAPCNPANNTVNFSVIGVGPISVYGTTTTPSGGSYKITGNGNGGDITFEYAGINQPTAGLYRIQPLGGSFSTGDVRVTMVSSSIYWQSSQGWVYVTIVNGKVVATFCDVSFSGSLGGPSYTTLATAKLTEE